MASSAPGLAWGQDGGIAELPPEVVLLVETFRALGLPGVLALIAFQAGRHIGRLQLTVRIHPEDLERIERALDRHSERSKTED